MSTDKYNIDKWLKNYIYKILLLTCKSRPRSAVYSPNGNPPGVKDHYSLFWVSMVTKNNGKNLKIEETWCSFGNSEQRRKKHHPVMDENHRLNEFT